MQRLKCKTVNCVEFDQSSNLCSKVQSSQFSANLWTPKPFNSFIIDLILVVISLIQSRSEDAEGEAREGGSRGRKGRTSADPTEEKGEEVVVVVVAAEEGQIGRVGARRKEGEEKAEKEGGVRRNNRRRSYRQL